MLYDQKIIAMTPCGRKRYMDLLAGHVKREHDAGHIDEWILFNNAYVREDSTYADQLAEQWPWVTVLRAPVKGRENNDKAFTWSRPEHIADFFKLMTQRDNVVYFRLDDDIVYIDPDCLPRLIKYRVENPAPFLVFPTIVNNVRTSYHFQQQGIVSADWGIRNEMCDEVAWKHPAFVFDLHMRALAAIERGPGELSKEFSLKTEQYTDYESGRISINCFAITGADMMNCKVAADEESYLSWWRPRELGRFNARVGDATVVHFAYHTQTEFMDKTGLLDDYVRVAPALEFRTRRLAPDRQQRDQPPQVQAALPQRPSLRQGMRQQIGRVGAGRPIQSPRGHGVKA